MAFCPRPDRGRLEDFDRAATHLQKTSGALLETDVSPDTLLAGRIRDPSTRERTLRGGGHLAASRPDLAIYRALGDLDAMMDRLEESLLGPDSMYVYLPAVYMVLGPEFSQDERVTAILRRFRGEPDSLQR
ncbi:MAG: hypothetical protein O7I93_01845 [Gemmatimonadetes bacterium]|nr:hypothetical protein [Gemmatimonadota bacterium]